MTITESGLGRFQLTTSLASCLCAIDTNAGISFALVPVATAAPLLQTNNPPAPFRTHPSFAIAAVRDPSPQMSLARTPKPQPLKQPELTPLLGLSAMRGCLAESLTDVSQCSIQARSQRLQFG